MALLKFINRRLVRQEGGFTLVELMVVIAILGVLAAVVIPNFIGLIGQGQTNANKADLVSVQSAVDAYMADNKIDGVAVTIPGAPLNLVANAVPGGVLAPYFRTAV